MAQAERDVDRGGVGRLRRIRAVGAEKAAAVPIRLRGRPKESERNGDSVGDERIETVVVRLEVLQARPLGGGLADCSSCRSLPGSG